MPKTTSEKQQQRYWKQKQIQTKIQSKIQYWRTLYYNTIKNTPIADATSKVKLSVIYSGNLGVSKRVSQYWKHKAANPLFHPNLHGGQR